MLLTQLITHFFFAIGASASVGISFSVTPNGHSQQPLNALDDEDLRVPGKNPLTYCDDPKDYILDIDHVDLDPNPPQAYVLSICAYMMTRALGVSRETG